MPKLIIDYTEVSSPLIPVPGIDFDRQRYYPTGIRGLSVRKTSRGNTYYGFIPGDGVNEGRRMRLESRSRAGAEMEYHNLILISQKRRKEREYKEIGNRGWVLRRNRELKKQKEQALVALTNLQREREELEQIISEG